MNRFHRLFIVVTGLSVMAGTLGMFGCKGNHAGKRNDSRASGIDTIASLCTYFQPPALWQKYDSTTLRTIINPNDKQRGSLHLDGAAGYYLSSGPFCTISALVDSADPTFPITGSKIQDYCLYVKKNLSSAGTVSIMQSENSGYLLTTLRISAQEALIFKVVFFEEKKNKAFEADYILPAPSNSDTVLIHTLMNSTLSFKPVESCR